MTQTTIYEVNYVSIGCFLVKIRSDIVRSRNLIFGFLTFQQLSIHYPLFTLSTIPATINKNNNMAVNPVACSALYM